MLKNGNVSLTEQKIIICLFLFLFINFLHRLGGIAEHCATIRYQQEVDSRGDTQS